MAVRRGCGDVAPSRRASDHWPVRLLRIEFNLQIIAAILTIVGYSLNDTVVVFDRIREYLRKYKAMPLADLIDFSLNSVLPRTILTPVTTMLALIALYALVASPAASPSP